MIITVIITFPPTFYYENSQTHTKAERIQQRPHTHHLDSIIHILPRLFYHIANYLFTHLSSHKSTLFLRQMIIRYSALRITSGYSEHTEPLSVNFWTCFTVYVFTLKPYELDRYLLTVYMCEVLGEVLRRTLRWIRHVSHLQELKVGKWWRSSVIKAVEATQDPVRIQTRFHTALHEGPSCRGRGTEPASFFQR